MKRAPADGGETIHTRAPEAAAGERADTILATLLPAQSRSFIKKLMDEGWVEIAGAPRKPSYRLRGGESIDLFLPELAELEARPEPLDLEILYEDEDIIVINKRPGMVVHPSPGHETGSLVNGLLHHCQDLSGIGGVLRPGIVHRLDRDTSGALVAAKHDQAHQALARQFAERTTTKTYLALTWGTPDPAAGTVRTAIGRHPVHRVRMAVVAAGGKHAVTHYRVHDTHGPFAAVECRLETGRTHQIRVHLSHLGCPILCDSTYGREQALTRAALCGHGQAQARGREAAVLLARQALHARVLGLTHPGRGETMTFTAPVPADMQAVLTLWQATAAG